MSPAPAPKVASHLHSRHPLIKAQEHPPCYLPSTVLFGGTKFPHSLLPFNEQGGTVLTGQCVCSLFHPDGVSSAHIHTSDNTQKPRGSDSHLLHGSELRTAVTKPVCQQVKGTLV